MVTETAPPPTETEVVPTPEPEAPESTEESPPEQPTPEAEQPAADLDTEFNAFVGTPTSEEAPSSGSADSLPPEVEQEVQKRVLTHQQEQQRQLQELGRLNHFRDTATRLRSNLTAQGLPDNLQSYILNEFNSYHNDYGQIITREAGDAAAITSVQEFYKAAAPFIPSADRDAWLAARGSEHKSQADTVKALVDHARKGYVKESEVKKQVAAAKVDTKKWFEDKGLIAGSKAPPNGNGSGGAAGSYTLDQIDEMGISKFHSLVPDATDRRRILDDAHKRAGR